LPSVLNWLGYAVGLVAGLQQLIVWFRSRRLTRAQNRAFEILNSQLNADEAKEAAEKYEALRSSLREQIEFDIPREARRAYLRNRLSRLAENLSREYGEYAAIESELRLPSSESQLDGRIRSVVEESLMPEMHARQGRERMLLGLVGLLVLLNLLPFGSLPTQLLPVLLEPPRHSFGASALSFLFLVTVAFASTVVGLSILRPSWAARLARSWSTSSVIVLATYMTVPSGIGSIYIWTNAHIKPHVNFSDYRTNPQDFSDYTAFWLLVVLGCVMGIVLGTLAFCLRTRRVQLRLGQTSEGHARSSDGNGV
jgi:uncharacterized membrane-anchored protein YhcB (DUF1043 family)